MIRLIDAEELLKEFNPNGEPIDPITVRMRIVQTPTAFDFDKVVSELEDYKMWKELLIYDLDFRERQIIKRALEIVWRGGIDVES